MSDDDKKELQALREDIRRWSDTADRLLILEDQGMPWNVRRLLREIAEAKA